MVNRIEAVAIVPARGWDVWRSLADHTRWPEWHAPDEADAGAVAGGTAGGAGRASGGARLTQVEALAGPPDRVGAAWRCTAVLPALPLIGRRQATWIEVVADARSPWTLELEAARVGRLLRRWRVRLTLVEQADGQTRLRCRVSYARASAAAWLLDWLFLRRAIAAGVEGALAGLARSFAADATSAGEVTPFAIDSAAGTSPPPLAPPLHSVERAPGGEVSAEPIAGPAFAATGAPPLRGAGRAPNRTSTLRRAGTRSSRAGRGGAAANAYNAGGGTNVA